MKHRYYFYSFLLPALMLTACREQQHAAVAHTDTIVQAVPPVDSAVVALEPVIDDTATAVETTDFKNFVSYSLKDTIREDLNGDEIADKAYFSGRDDTRHIYITDGKTNEVVKVGSDTSFHSMGDRFDWVDSWGVTKDSSTFEILFVNEEIAGSKQTRLEHPSIVVRKEEVGGGVITYRDGAYKWVHQSD